MSEPQPQMPMMPGFPEDLGHEAADAAHRVVNEGENWHAVDSSELDAAHPLTDRERRLVVRSAGDAVASHNDFQEREKLREAQRFDDLTGCRTMEVLRDDLPRAIALAMRVGQAFALFAVDGKSLSEVNNNIGRSVGDEYIIAIAKALKGSIRHSDGVYRGGFKADEFFVMLPLINETGDELEIFLRDKESGFERNVRERLRERPQLRETVSSFGTGVHIGLAWRDFSQDYSKKTSEQIAEELLEEADRSLMSAKRQAKQEKPD